MKKLIIALFILIGTTPLLNTVNAQHISINVNIGKQPAWGPVGYDYVGYYYFPDIDCYYDVDLDMYYYPERGRWISARYLPHAYYHYDLYSLYKVVLNDHKPWLHNRYHRKHYAHYVGHRHQAIIRDSRDHRYNHSRKNNYAWSRPDNRKHSSDRYNSHNNRSSEKAHRDMNQRPATRPGNRDVQKRNNSQAHSAPARTRENRQARENKSVTRENKVTRENSRPARSNDNNSNRNSSVRQERNNMVRVSNNDSRTRNSRSEASTASNRTRR